MQKTYTTVVGGVLLLVGLLGLVPAANTANEYGSLLLGFIQINPAQNYIHILTGIVALAALASTKGYYLRAYVQVFAVVYTLVALWGIGALAGGTVDNVLFGLIKVNIWTELVHILIGAWGLYVGFMMSGSSKKAAA